MAKAKKKARSIWQNRIVGYGVADPMQLLANPKNYRIHPKYQQDVLGAVLDDVGIVQNIVVNKRTDSSWSDGERNVETVLDGHLRVAMAISNGINEMPVTYVDLTEGEESLVLATLDQITGLAGTDQDVLSDLISGIHTDNEALANLLSELAARPDVDVAPPTDKEIEDARQTLAERFIVPPFTVLDARQGYWQERKKAWIAIGIKGVYGRFGKDSAETSDNEAEQ